MTFTELFKRLPLEKEKNSIKVSSNPDYDRIILLDMPKILKEMLRNQGISNITIRQSVGQGIYADVPWICLLSTNPSISPSPQKGIYIVLLFSEDGGSFYLTLGQGITNFKQRKVSSKTRNEIIKKTVEYFQNEIDRSLFNIYGFTSKKINLGKKPKELAKGYSSTAIISKQFFIDKFDEDDFFESLMALISEYNVILEHIGDKSYDDIIELFNPSNGVEDFDDALESMTLVLKEELASYRDIELMPVEVIKGEKRSNKYSKFSQKKIFKKTDYLKQAKDNHQTGLRGEEIALKIEKKRLGDLGLEPSEYLKWVSIESDSYGYDFQSVDFINGELSTIYIEVKATKDLNDTPFFVSKNEINISQEKSEKYRVIRIFDITSTKPKYYVAIGAIEENFYLDPITYQARYKYEILS